MGQPIKWNWNRLERNLCSKWRQFTQPGRKAFFKDAFRWQQPFFLRHHSDPIFNKSIFYFNVFTAEKDRKGITLHVMTDFSARLSLPCSITSKPQEIRDQARWLGLLRHHTRHMSKHKQPAHSICLNKYSLFINIVQINIRRRFFFPRFWFSLLGEGRKAEYIIRFGGADASRGRNMCVM